jgi:hypothetical protein
MKELITEKGYSYENLYSIEIKNQYLTIPNSCTIELEQMNERRNGVTTDLLKTEFYLLKSKKNTRNSNLYIRTDQRHKTETVVAHFLWKQNIKSSNSLTMHQFIQVNYSPYIQRCNIINGRKIIQK